MGEAAGRPAFKKPKVLRDNFGGGVPKTLEQLVTLPGVGRKTANVVLGNARDHKTGEPFGMPGYDDASLVPAGPVTRGMRTVSELLGESVSAV